MLLCRLCMMRRARRLGQASSGSRQRLVRPSLCSPAWPEPSNEVLASDLLCYRGLLFFKIVLSEAGQQHKLGPWGLKVSRRVLSARAIGDQCHLLWAQTSWGRRWCSGT
jgi:hypothetical protein